MKVNFINSLVVFDKYVSKCYTFQFNTNEKCKSNEKKSFWYIGFYIYISIRNMSQRAL